MTAESLRFTKVPNPKVEFTGQPKRETVWDSQRENLPRQVRPGVTYRNIGITLRITSVFADIDRIVAEALGEIPPSDDAQPQPAAPERPASPPDSQKNPDGGAQVLDDKSADDASAAPANAAANSPNAGAAPRQPAPQTPTTATSPARASTPHRRVPARRGRNK